MSKGVNIYEIMQRFWRENEYEPFSTAEISLYFFLINRANYSTPRFSTGG